MKFCVRETIRYTIESKEIQNLPADWVFSVKKCEIFPQTKLVLFFRKSFTLTKILCPPFCVLGICGTQQEDDKSFLIVDLWREGRKGCLNEIDKKIGGCQSGAMFELVLRAL